MSDFFASLSSNPDAASTWVIAFWLSVLIGVGIAVYRWKAAQRGLALKSQPKPTPTPTAAPVLTAEEQKAEEEKAAALKQARIRSYEERLKKGRRTLPTIEYVDIDWRNKKHALALAGLMQEPAKLHPTLRFHFDPSVVDNAYMAMLMAAAHQHIDRTTAPKKATTTKKPVKASKAVIPLRKQHTQ